MVASPTEVQAMRRAMQLAERGGCHPNPCVGAIVLDLHETVAEGVTEAWPGTAHAERRAMEAAGERTRGATVVVTLEPCDHAGRTPPCTTALIEAGVSRVVVGALDPDRRVAGSGVARLRAAGVDVETGILAEEVESIDRAYFHHRRTGRPLVTLKAALTLDGQMAAADGTSQWITSPEARTDGHRLRSRVDAVMVGSGTIRSDDPRLDVRLADHEGRQPRAVVVEGRRPVPTDAKVLTRPDTLVVIASDGRSGAGLLEVPGDPDGRPRPAAMLDALGERGVVSLLVEGGPTLAGALWRHDLIDDGVFYLAARLAGGQGRPVLDGEWRTLAEAASIRIDSVGRVGPDLRVSWTRVQESVDGL